MEKPMRGNKLKFVSIGVYGYQEEDFFNALRDAGVDVFIDLRQRRGLRGTKYAFANSQRLQNRLREMGLNYIHLRELAPPPEVRAIQNEMDRKAAVKKRKRARLSPEFIRAYKNQVLDRFDFQSLFNRLPQETRTVALFCVERYPEACHRSIVAAHLAENYPVETEDIV
jgi:uncharacterized protein (DUF488 family)